MDYSLKFVVGIKVTRRTEERSRSVTRFDSRTGERLQVHIAVYRVSILLGNGASITLEDYDESHNGYPVELRDLGVDTDLCYFGGCEVVGEVHSTGDYTCGGNPLVSPTPPASEIESTVLKVSEQLKTLGTNTRPELFTVLAVSY